MKQSVTVVPSPGNEDHPVWHAYQALSPAAKRMLENDVLMTPQPELETTQEEAERFKQLCRTNKEPVLDFQLTIDQPDNDADYVRLTKLAFVALSPKVRSAVLKIMAEGKTDTSLLTDEEFLELSDFSIILNSDPEASPMQKAVAATAQCLKKMSPHAKQLAVDMMRQRPTDLSNIPIEVLRELVAFRLLHHATKMS